MIFYGLDMRSRGGSCVGAWDEIYASLYPVMQLDSASLHLAHGLRPMTPNKKAPPHASMDEAFYI